MKHKHGGDLSWKFPDISLFAVHICPGLSWRVEGILAIDFNSN